MSAEDIATTFVATGGGTNPLSWIATGLQVVGSIFQFGAQKKQAEAEREAARARARQLEYQAQLNEKEAYYVEDQTREQIKTFRLQVAKEYGSNRASIGASGVTMEGSATAVLEENARNAKRDEMNIKLAGDRRAEALREQARLNRMGRDSSAKAGDDAYKAGTGASYANLINGLVNSVSRTNWNTGGGNSTIGNSAGGSYTDFGTFA